MCERSLSTIVLGFWDSFNIGKLRRCLLDVSDEMLPATFSKEMYYQLGSCLVSEEGQEGNMHTMESVHHFKRRLQMCSLMSMSVSAFVPFIDNERQVGALYCTGVRASPAS